MSIKFKNKDHEKFYEQCLGRTGSLDLRCTPSSRQ